ncbi:MAG: hypothetical protein Q9201_006230 [Fulgogasparrea decipioides]
MHLDVHPPRPQRPLKRSFDDDDDYESVHPPKRPHLPPTPPIPDHCHDKLYPPSRPQSTALTPPKTAEPLFEPACNPATTRRIDSWLEESLSEHSSSASLSSPTHQTPAAVSLDEYQSPALAATREMSQSQGQPTRSGSVVSAQSSRQGTSSTIYPSILYYNGIRFDRTGEKIPEALRAFLNSEIFKEQPSPMSAEEVAQTVTTALNIVNSSEDKVYELIHTAMFPIRRPEIGQGGNTPWYVNALPKDPLYPVPLATPKPDIHCGYSIAIDPEPFWSLKEKAVMDHPRMRQFSQPAKDNCYPFFVAELKSEASGGTLLHAERQAAGSGASCVNSMRGVLEEAFPFEKLSTVDSIAFSACVTHREAIIHVHWYDPEERLHYMSWIGSFDTLRNSQGCSRVVKSIFDHAIDTRLPKLRQALRQLYPFPVHWKMSRSASTQALSLAEEDDGSKKSQRTD